MPLLRRAFELLVAFVIVFEEWGWDPLQAWLGRLAQRFHLVRLERWIASLPPYGALAVFGMPALALLPIKIAALALVADDHPIAGLLLIAAAKIVGTAVVARIFGLTKPALLQLPWFAATYGRWLRWKAALLARVRTSRPWIAARVVAAWVDRRVSGQR